jgi:hypothetical protein
MVKLVSNYLTQSQYRSEISLKFVNSEPLSLGVLAILKAVMKNDDQVIASGVALIYRFCTLANSCSEFGYSMVRGWLGCGGLVPYISCSGCVLSRRSWS